MTAAAQADRADPVVPAELAATPEPAPLPASVLPHETSPARRVRVYVWQVPVRITHWVTAGAIVVLAITGLYIADPFLLPGGGRTMETVRLVHMLSAFTFLVSGAIRMAWLLVGNRWARWGAFVPTTREQVRELFRQAAFYAFLRREIPKVVGHNQLAATAYGVLFALLLVETITGFALDGLIGAEPGKSLFWWVREIVGPQNLRLVHHVAMWAILAIALFHVYSCVLVDHLERNGLVSSIVSGFKFPTRADVLESRDGGPEVLAAAEAAEAASDEAAEAAGEEAPR